MPAWPDTVTVTFAVGASDSCTVNVPSPPSATVTLVVDSTKVFSPVTCTVNPRAVACGSAPPPATVPLSASKPFAPVPSGPSTTSMFLPAAAAFADSSSVAVCTSSVASPVNVTFGVAVPSPDSATPSFKPSPVFTASDQSVPATTPVPPIASGTTITSPAASLRPKLTVNAALLASTPARITPASVRESDTTVASLSTIVTSACGSAPSWNQVVGESRSASRNRSGGSSSISSVALSTAVTALAPLATGSLTHGALGPPPADSA